MAHLWYVVLGQPAFKQESLGRFVTVRLGVFGPPPRDLEEYRAERLPTGGAFSARPAPRHAA